jgi:hypothetical protein
LSTCHLGTRFVAQEQRVGKLKWEGWQTSVDDAAQPTTGIVFGANLRSQAEIDGPNYDRRNDFVLALLEKAALPLTRENYLGLAYPEGLPEGWSDIDEMTLPPEIRGAE